jgi:hypothetical protein
VEIAVGALQGLSYSAVPAFDRVTLERLMTKVTFDAALLRIGRGTKDQDVLDFNELVEGKVPSACISFWKKRADESNCDMVVVSERSLHMLVRNAMKTLATRRRVFLLERDEAVRFMMADLFRAREWVVLHAGDGYPHLVSQL